MEEKYLKNMRELLEQMEQKLAERRIIRYMVGTEIVEISSEQFFRQVRTMSRQLERRGLRRKHIGIIGRNSYEWLICFCAVFWTEAVAVLLDWESDADTISELTKRVDLDAILYDEASEEHVQKARLLESVQIISMSDVGKTQTHCKAKEKRY